MRQKQIINGEELDQPFILRTTETIKDNLMAESFAKNTSMNMVINKVLSRWANQRMKKQSSNNKKSNVR